MNPFLEPKALLANPGVLQSSAFLTRRPSAPRWAPSSWRRKALQTLGFDFLGSGFVVDDVLCLGTASVELRF